MVQILKITKCAEFDLLVFFNFHATHFPYYFNISKVKLFFVQKCGKKEEKSRLEVITQCCLMVRNHHNLPTKYIAQVHNGFINLIVSAGDGQLCGDRNIVWVIGAITVNCEEKKLSPNKRETILIFDKQFFNDKISKSLITEIEIYVCECESTLMAVLS